MQGKCGSSVKKMFSKRTYEQLKQSHHSSMAVLDSGTAAGAKPNNSRFHKKSSVAPRKNKAKKIRRLVQVKAMDISDSLYASHLLLKVCGFWPGKWRVFACAHSHCVKIAYIIAFLERASIKYCTAHHLDINHYWRKYVSDIRAPIK